MQALTRRNLELVDEQRGVRLYRNTVSGVAWVEGLQRRVAAHPGYPFAEDMPTCYEKRWRFGDRLVIANSYIWNIDQRSGNTPAEVWARAHCRCGGLH